MEPSHITKYDLNVIRANVKSVFEKDFTQFLKAKDWHHRLALVKQSDGPPMKVISWRTIEKLGYIPRYDECEKHGYTIPFEEAMNTPNVGGVTFFSHRWLSPNLDPKLARPDDNSNIKAKAIVALGKYTLNVYKNEQFYWVDWCCIDQDNSGPGAMMLPLYAVCCDGMVSFITEGYWDRGWCRVERAVFTATRSPRAWTFYPPGQVPSVQDKDKVITIDDPSEGIVSVAYDKELVGILSELCKDIYKKAREANFDGTNDYLSDNWNWFVTPTLEYGTSGAYCWCMNHYSGLVW